MVVAEQEGTIGSVNSTLLLPPSLPKKLMQVQEALHPPANGRFFSVARPGDLVWVMAPSFRSERSSHTVAAAEDHNMSLADDYAPDPFRAEALLGMIDGLASSQATLDARAIAASLVHSAAKDSGFESAANSDKPCVDGSDSQCADIGEHHLRLCWYASVCGRLFEVVCLADPTRL